MADKTTNYNLAKPSTEDFYDVGVQNNNMDIIDDKLKNLNDGKAPSGHGLGEASASFQDRTLLDMMEKGCGFYQVQGAEDTPANESSWINLLQSSRETLDGKSTGFQIAAFDYYKNNPQMWFRTVMADEASTWNEILHTGNISKLTPFKFVTGSYVGTGKNDESNPNVITTDIIPQLVFVLSEIGQDWGILLRPSTEGFIFSTNGSQYYRTSANVTWDDNSVSWHDLSSAMFQLNSSSKIYYYIAIGYGG